MSHRQLGRGNYTAIRSGLTVRLIASGIKPNLQAKPDFEVLPFLIYPPLIGFYFVSPDIVNPVIVPFTYEESFPYSSTAKLVRIQDADGFHDVQIQDIVVPSPVPGTPSPGDQGYCVFSIIGTNKLMIAKCDAPIIMIYTRVFGPDTHKHCEEYVASHGGSGFQ